MSLQESLDTTTASGKFMFTVFSALSQFESDLMSERIKDVIDHKKSKGEKIGTIPYGFKEVNGKLKKHAPEQKIIKRVYSLRDNGYTYDAIKQEFKKKKIKNRRGNTTWHLNSLYRIVKNRKAK